MNRPCLFIFLITLAGFSISGSPAQERPRRSVRPPVFPSDSSLAIVTKVPFNGRNYFIRIVPVDSSFHDPMPIFNPERGRTVFWMDSLQRLLPDSLLRLLPRNRGRQ